MSTGPGADLPSRSNEKKTESRLGGRSKAGLSTEPERVPSWAGVHNFTNVVVANGACDLIVGHYYRKKVNNTFADRLHNIRRLTVITVPASDATP